MIVGIAAFALLVLGGTLGGALAYVYGVRVVKQDVPLADAVIAGRLKEPSSGSRGSAAGGGGRTDWTGWSAPR